MMLLIGKLTSSNATPEELCDALESLEYYVEDVDNANGLVNQLNFKAYVHSSDLNKINGIGPVISLLHNVSPGVRKNAALVIASVASNNPAGQAVMLQAGAVPALVEMINAETDASVIARGLTAISGECF